MDRIPGGADGGYRSRASSLGVVMLIADRLEATAGVKTADEEFRGKRGLAVDHVEVLHEHECRGIHAVGKLKRDQAVFGLALKRFRDQLGFCKQFRRPQRGVEFR